MSQLPSASQAQGSAFGIDSSVPDFQTETQRLLRDDWESQGVTTFSQEVWALMQLLQNFNTTGKATATQQAADTPPITINQPFSIGSGPGIVINRLGQDGQVASSLAITPQGITTDDGSGPIPIGAGGGGLPGSIVSGTGNTYLVNLTGPPAKTVTVTQLQIDPSATIPAGTSVIVYQVGTKYVMLVPVWL